MVNSICLISASHPDILCGVGLYNYNIAKALTQHIPNVTIITTDDPRIRTPPPKGVTLKPIIKTWGFRDAGTLMRAVHETAPDIVHIQYPGAVYKANMMILFAPLLLKLTGLNVPYIESQHEFISAHILRKAASSILLYSCDKVLLSNKSDSKFIQARLPFLKNKIHLLPVGSQYNFDPLPQSRLLEFRNSQGLAEDDLVMLYFGFIRKNKKLENILQALACLNGAVPKLKFVIAGVPSRTEYLDELKNLVQHLKIEKHVLFTGELPHDEISTAMQAADMGILLFDGEEGASAKNTTIFAFMSHGLPTIASNGNNIVAGFQDSHNISLVENEDIHGIASKIQKLANSPEMREKMGIRIKELFDTTYTWGSLGEKLMNIYQNALNKKMA